MRSLVQPLLFLAIGIILAGCAGPVPKIDSSPSALAKIHSIAVIRSPEPGTYIFLNIGSGVPLGLAGGLVAAGDNMGKQDQLTLAVKRQNPSPTSSYLADGIANQLASLGFDARVEDGPWEESDGKFKFDFDKINSSADAVLVVTPTMVGFIAEGFAGSYLPTIIAGAKLLGKDRKEIMYQGFHATGWRPRADGWRYTPSRITFVNFDDLMSDPKKTADVLSAAASNIAGTVAEDLRR